MNHSQSSRVNYSQSSRRCFIKTAIGGAVLGPLALTTVKGASEGFPNFARGEVVRTGGEVTGDGRFIEKQRAIPVAGRVQVIVCGGGPAGMGAAIAAARAGAKTLLIEMAGCLGGTWTAGLLTKIIDGERKTGVMQEILQAMAERGSDVAKKTKGSIYDPELMKLVLEEMCLAAGVRIQLHTLLAGAVTDLRNRLVAVVTESKSGRQAWMADRFIDCTGDGDLAVQAGCKFDIGANDDCDCQPMSLLALLTGVDPAAIPGFVREIAGEKAKTNLRKLMEDAGIHPSYALPTLRHLHSGIFSLMTNHEYGVPAYDAAKISEATIRARREVFDIIRDMRKLGGPWKNLAVVATAEQIGVREGRRIHGRYTVTADDLREGRKHADAVCRVNAGIDVHSVDPKKTKGIAKADFRAKPYDIPLRALMAKDVDGLMLAGRCISGDFIAHSSYRVTGNAVAMGEAAGKVSVESLQKGVLPHELAAR